MRESFSQETSAHLCNFTENIKISNPADPAGAHSTTESDDGKYQHRYQATGPMQPALGKGVVYRKSETKARVEFEKSTIHPIVSRESSGRRPTRGAEAQRWIHIRSYRGCHVVHCGGDIIARGEGATRKNAVTSAWACIDATPHLQGMFFSINNTRH
jgi:hypothetical protein